MTQYIDKDTVIEEINRQYNHLREHPGTCGSGYILGFRQACWQIIDFCNSLEVKEVDLEKELTEWHKEHFKKDGTFIGMSGFYLTNNSQMDIAKHFFELGLNHIKSNKNE